MKLVISLLLATSA